MSVIGNTGEVSELVSRFFEKIKEKEEVEGDYEEFI